MSQLMLDHPVIIRRSARLPAILTMCIVEARPCVLVIFLLRFLAGAILTGHGNLPRVLAGAAAWELAVFFIYLFNGAMDIHEDLVNGSRRPIARGALPRRPALGVAFCAAMMSLASALLFARETALPVAAVLAIGYMYSGPPFRLKCSPAGTVVTCALLGLATYDAGQVSVAASTGHPGIALAVFAVAMSLWMGLVGAPAKDLPDIAGDAQAGRRTLAMLVGERRFRLALALVALGLGIAFLAVAASTVHVIVWPAATMLTGAAAVAFLSLSPLSQGSRTRLRLPYRGFMVTQYATHLSLALAFGTQVLLSG
jgi:4-hydroxybenzoate polyprenyltransferase